VQQLRELTSSDDHLIGRIIADGFADDPVNLWTFGGTGAMKPAFTAMAQHLYLKRGFGHVSADGLAGTLWLPPGAAKSYGVGNLALAWHIVRHGGLTAVRHSLAIDGFMAARRAPLAPHFYLFAIAVNPALQGKGIGSQLMNAALERVDAAHMPAYLENSKYQNIAFYRKHGFELMQETVPAPGCPPMWLMWRPARGA
jgi:GNAT superfamily N-acetyltransferase